MAIRIMEYGPTVSNNRRRNRVTTGVVRKNNRTGVIFRNAPGPMVTTKSQLRRKVIKGIRPPGQMPYNYPSATN